MKHQIHRRSFLQSTAAAVGAIALPNIIASRSWGQNAPSRKLNVALVGCGARGGLDLQSAMQRNVNLIALCDADLARTQSIRATIAKAYPEGADMLAKAKSYQDYRELIANEPSLDAVIIAVGPWWHVALSTAFMKAGKHVYCEKPLAHMVGEARALGELAKASKVVTQMGTQGVAGRDFRRSIEIVHAGLLGQVRELHVWESTRGRPFEPSHARPEGEDKVPEGFNWDLWVGPKPMRPFKAKTYQHGCRLAMNWLDYGTGLLGDFGTHTWQLPIRALKLDYPTQVEHSLPEPVKETFVSSAKIRYQFAKRGELEPLTAWFYDAIHMPPPNELLKEIEAYYKGPVKLGAVMVGENGWLYSGGWGGGNFMKLKGDNKMSSVLKHPAALALAQTEPLNVKQDHMQEWIDACLGNGKTYQPFEVAAHSMEVILPGIVSLRIQRAIDWDGPNMCVPNAPEADQFIKPVYRTNWL
jgi:predicted dehydrogenase